MIISASLNQHTLSREHRFHERGRMALSLAHEIKAALEWGIARRGRASLVLCGGGTGGLLLPYLQALRLPWEKVTVTLSDERWTAPEHEDSHEGLVRRELLLGHVSCTRFVGLMGAEATPELACEAREKTLSFMAQPFDVVLLGMDLQGNTASLFPATPSEVLEGSAPALVVPAASPTDGHRRISLAPRALLHSRHSFVAFTGDDKLEVYRRALVQGPFAELPVRSILHGASRYGVDVFWAP